MKLNIGSRFWASRIRASRREKYDDDAHMSILSGRMACLVVSGGIDISVGYRQHFYGGPARQTTVTTL